MLTKASYAGPKPDARPKAPKVAHSVEVLTTLVEITTYQWKGSV